MKREKRYLPARLLAKYALYAVVTFFVYIDVPAQVRLPRVIRDSMVLQRDARVRCWGWSAPGEKVSIRFNGKTYKTKASADGKWQVWLPPMKAGGPYTMDIDASNHLRLNDVLVGDVWICSGQSNMVHQMALHSERYAAEIASANNPQIRHFWIPTMTDLQQPHDDLPAGSWKSANPQDVRDFSAVAYFFAKAIYDKYHVPIGLINASVGGSPIQAWTSEEGLAAFPNITATIQKNKDSSYTSSFNRHGGASANSYSKPVDKGFSAIPQWYDTTYVPTHWRPITVPGYWEDQGVRDLDGAVWYRKEVEIPASMTGMPARLVLGRIVDADVVYLNGKQVGNTTYMYPQRRYVLPAGALKPGKNLLVVRITNNGGKGGFVPDKPYCITTGNDTIDLKGTWWYKVGEVAVPAQMNRFSGFSAQNSPSALYNAMLAPETKYTIKGILWYQGESNTGNPAEYGKLIPALIKDWRSKWGEGELPFLYVQLPNFSDVQYLPAESQWAATREAQLHALKVRNTGMAVTIDLGEWNDIHPDHKKEVGDRLALLAQKIAYGETMLVASGPLFESAKVTGDTIVVSFTNTGGGLITNDGEAPGEFAIAGADKKFVWAKATIEGNKVKVWNEAIASPLYVRYAWADNPDNPNLYNKEGLPASPFRTDH
ncbi:9-O-acetylesterase [Niastella vici]|uniref:9-O-acetylesterase n=1 Tax=Niastella vici TaxID=1703345 RepID=A0A1V9FZG1_9BACT|nr:sialate O-acetylesterase [Niastella vici]OQP63720.1 9-O-acetylesterase [Niastella vici]